MRCNPHGSLHDCTAARSAGCKGSRHSTMPIRIRGSDSIFIFLVWWAAVVCSSFEARSRMLQMTDGVPAHWRMQIGRQASASGPRCGLGRL